MGGAHPPTPSDLPSSLAVAILHSEWRLWVKIIWSSGGARRSGRRERAASRGASAAKVARLACKQRSTWGARANGHAICRPDGHWARTCCITMSTSSGHLDTANTRSFARQCKRARGCVRARVWPPLLPIVFAPPPDVGRASRKPIRADTSGTKNRLNKSIKLSGPAREKQSIDQMHKDAITRTPKQAALKPRRPIKYRCGRRAKSCRSPRATGAERPGDLDMSSPGAGAIARAHGERVERCGRSRGGGQAGARSRASGCRTAERVGARRQRRWLAGVRAKRGDRGAPGGRLDVDAGARKSARPV